MVTFRLHSKMPFPNGIGIFYLILLPINLLEIGTSKRVS